jgi:hypothetical protein
MHKYSFKSPFAMNESQPVKFSSTHSLDEFDIVAKAAASPTWNPKEHSPLTPRGTNPVAYLCQGYLSPPDSFIDQRSKEKDLRT